MQMYCTHLNKCTSLFRYTPVDQSKLCGSSWPSPVKSHSNNVTLIFSTDGTTTASGFKIRWEAFETGNMTLAAPLAEWSLLLLEEVGPPQTFSWIDIVGSISQRCTVPPPITDASYDDDNNVAILYNPLNLRKQLVLGLAFGFGHHVLDAVTNTWRHLNVVENLYLSSFSGSE